MDYWHVLNRGVDKRSIVTTDRDRMRFVQNLIELNDSERVENAHYAHIKLGRTDGTRNRLVTVHAWCLMGNHYHLLLSPVADGGVSRFLQKLNIGYTMHFNKKYNRTGALFQGKTKRVRIENDRQFLYILPYIHLNPLDFLKGFEQWRSQCVLNPDAALKWVTEYRWSSFRNYMGTDEFVPVLEGSDLFSDRETHVHELKRYIVQQPEIYEQSLSLE